MRSTPYELELESRVGVGPDVYRFRSADGVVSKEEFRPAELALLSAAEPIVSPDDSVLVVDGNWGLVPAVLDHLAGSVTVTETSARAAELCRRNARENDADPAIELVADVAELEDSFDLAVYAPRPYDPLEVGNQKLADALARLQPGGTVLVAASKRDGGRRYRDTLAELAGDAERLRGPGDVEVSRASRPERYDPPTVVEPRVIRATVAGHDLEFVTRPGLFSPASLDRGTALLAESVVAGTDRSPDRVLDVACGYGPLGTALAREYDPDVWFADDSRVATRCTRESADRNDIDPAGVATADCLTGLEGPFDLVVTNPPTHAGGGVTAELFDGARRELAPGGELWLVYNETMAYEEELARTFASVAVERRTEGYAITVARR